MDYQATLEYMYSQLPMFQRMGRPAFKPDLGNSHKLMELLDHPENKFRSIHIAGTNGKGSTAHMITSVMMEHGLRVGLYTSPHLKDFRERITINGEKVQKQFVVDFIRKHKKPLDHIGCSFFEMTVGMAFAWFAEQKVDAAVIETGMGGRLDSTNVINPLLSVITNIGLDHTFFLGDTLEKIAGEKAGIIKPATPVIIGKTQPETQAVFEKKAQENQANIRFADQEIAFSEPETSPEGLKIEKVYHNKQLILTDLQTDLSGAYQAENIRTALMTALLLQKEFDLERKKILNGFRKVIRNTHLAGRWQKLSDTPPTYCDTAHNAEGLQWVMKQLESIPKSKLHFVLGMVNDKHLEEILKLLPQKAQYYFCKADIPRGLPAKDLQKEAATVGLSGETYPSVKEALHTAQTAAQDKDVVFVGGSTFTVAEVL